MDSDPFCLAMALTRPALRGRSEEHTSELQSLRHLVCRLLLEKKKHERRVHACRGVLHRTHRSHHLARHGVQRRRPGRSLGTALYRVSLSCRFRPPGCAWQLFCEDLDFPRTLRTVGLFDKSYTHKPVAVHLTHIRRTPLVQLQWAAQLNLHETVLLIHCFFFFK